MRVYPFGVYFISFVHKNDAVNRGRDYEFGAGDSDSCIITMSPPPTSSTMNNQYKGMRPHIAAREAQGACVQ